MVARGFPYTFMPEPDLTTGGIFHTEVIERKKGCCFENILNIKIIVVM